MLLIDLRLTNSCPELWFSHQEDKSELQGATSNFLSWINPKTWKGLTTFNFHLSFRICFHDPHSCPLWVVDCLRLLAPPTHVILWFLSITTNENYWLSTDYCINVTWPICRPPMTLRNVDHRWLTSHHEKRTFNSNNNSTSTYTWGTFRLSPLVHSHHCKCKD